MQYYLLIYELVDDYLDRRPEFREAHLKAAREANARGELVLAGAVADPADRAYLVFRVPSAGLVEAFAREDPYVVNGLIKRWELREWKVMIGAAPAESSNVPKA